MFLGKKTSNIIISSIIHAMWFETTAAEDRGLIILPIGHPQPETWHPQPDTRGGLKKLPLAEFSFMASLLEFVLWKEQWSRTSLANGMTVCKHVFEKYYGKKKETFKILWQHTFLFRWSTNPDLVPCTMSPSKYPPQQHVKTLSPGIPPKGDSDIICVATWNRWKIKLPWQAEHIVLTNVIANYFENSIQRTFLRMKDPDVGLYPFLVPACRNTMY